VGRYQKQRPGSGQKKGRKRGFAGKGKMNCEWGGDGTSGGGRGELARAYILCKQKKPGRVEGGESGERRWARRARAFSHGGRGQVKPGRGGF